MGGNAHMLKTWGPFTGRQLTTLLVAGMVTLVLAPTTVWAVDQFSNVAVQDPVSGVKASVSSSHKVLVDAGSSNIYSLPSTAKNPFTTEYHVGNYGSAGFQAVSPPTTATIAITHLALTNDGYNQNAWAVYLYQVPGTTQSSCVSNMFGASYRRLASRSVPAGQTLAEDFTTPITVAPLSAGQSYCLVSGAEPHGSSIGTNSSSVLVDYSGYVASGSFAPPTTRLPP